MPDPNLTALLGTEHVRAAFTAISLDLLTGERISLLDGASEVVFAVQDAVTGVTSNRTFRGEDATFGTLAGFDAIEEGIAVNSPRLMVSINPPDTTAISILANPYNQGSIMRVWMGAVDTTTGTAYAGLEFIGRMDRARRGLQKNSSNLELDCSSYFDELFIEDEGLRMNDAAHRAIRPSEAGMAYVSAVNRKLPWGLEKGVAGAVMGGGSVNGGGMGGGGGGGGSLVDAYNILRAF